MRLVALNTSPYFTGVITNTPSGTSYNVKPGQMILAAQVDVALLLTFDFSLAYSAPVTVTDGITTVNAVTLIDFTSGATVTDGGNGEVSVAIAGGGGGAIRSSGRIVLSNAQLLTLFSAPISIIAAPGAGKYLLPLLVSYTYDAVANGFATPGGSPALFWGSPGEPNKADTGSGSCYLSGVPAIETASCFSNAGIGGGMTDRSVVENAALVLSCMSADMTGGDGGGSITVYYIVVDL